MERCDALKYGRTLFANTTPERRMSGMGQQVMSASRQLIVSRIRSTPPKVTKFVMSSGIIWA